MKREVYLRPPGDVCSRNLLWKLKCCIYGLNDAPRSWYNKVKSELMELKGKPSTYDPALYIWQKGNELIGLLGSHVDDFLFCGTREFHIDIISNIKQTFKISAEASCSFKYLGLQVNQTNGRIQISQEECVE